jgi:ATP-dependent RNA helicase DHX8/PRP22
VEQYPTYDPNLSMLAVEETEEETEEELAEVEPAFLRGQTKKSLHHSSNAPIMEPIKIVKNPDGSLQRAALQQANMAKQRRELRQAQANQLIDSIPKDLNRPWEDPLPEAGERHFAQELRSINVMSTAMDGAKERTHGSHGNQSNTRGDRGDGVRKGGCIKPGSWIEE